MPKSGVLVDLLSGFGLCLVKETLALAAADLLWEGNTEGFGFRTADCSQNKCSLSFQRAFIFNRCLKLKCLGFFPNSVFALKSW